MQNFLLFRFNCKFFSCKITSTLRNSYRLSVFPRLSEEFPGKYLQNSNFVERHSQNYSKFKELSRENKIKNQFRVCLGL